MEAALQLLVVVALVLGTSSLSNSLSQSSQGKTFLQRVAKLEGRTNILTWTSERHKMIEKFTSVEQQVRLVEWASRQGLGQCAATVVYDTEIGASVLSQVTSLRYFVRGTTNVNMSEKDLAEIFENFLNAESRGSCTSLLLLLTSRTWASFLNFSDTSPQFANAWAGQRRIFVLIQPTAYDDAKGGEQFVLHPALRKSTNVLLCHFAVNRNTWRVYSTVLYSGKRRHSTEVVAEYHPVTGVQWLARSALFSEDEFRNFQGYQFTIAALPYSPFVMPAALERSGPGKYSGLEVMLVDALAKASNFSYVYKAPPDGEWGRLLSNKSWTGLIGLVEREEADWAMSDITFSSERARYVDFSRTFLYDASELVTPRALPLPLFLGPVKPFTLAVWLMLAAAVTLAGPVLTTIARCSARENPWFLNTAHATMYTLQPVLMRGMPVEIHGTSCRVFAVSWLVSAMIISIMYTSSLTSFLILPGYSSPIMDLEQLVASNVGWGKVNFGGVQNALLEQAEDSVLVRLRQGMQWRTSLDDILTDVVAGSLATWDNRITTRLKVAERFTDKAGQPLVTLTGFELLQERIAWPLTLQAPFKNRFDVLIERARQAGLVNKWLQDVILEQRLLASQESESNDDSAGSAAGGQDTVVLTLEHLQGVFLLLVFGCGIGGLMFLIELATLRLESRKFFTRLFVIVE